MRRKKHHSLTQRGKRRRHSSERVKMRRDQSNQEMAERDRRVTEEFGEVGHRSCGRKRRYKTKTEALLMASKCARHGAPALRAYKCRYCSGWHLTSK